MKDMIASFVRSCWDSYIQFVDMAKCVSQKMTAYYDNNKWSCIVGDNYGSHIWSYVHYKYTYQDLGWIVFIGAY